MNIPLFKWALWGVITTSVAGCLSHFLYEFSRRSRLAACISPVNESVWEHLKLLYFPCIVYSAVEYAVSSPDIRTLWGRCCGLCAALLLMIVVYYTYTGVIGRGFLPADIALFFICDACCFGLSYRLGAYFPVPSAVEAWSWAALAAIFGVCLVLFTFITPPIALFADPQTGRFGLKARG